MENMVVSVTCRGEWKFDGKYHTYEGAFRKTKYWLLESGLSLNGLISEIKQKFQLDHDTSELKLQHRFGGDENRGLAPADIDDDSELEGCLKIYKSSGCLPLYVTMVVPSRAIVECIPQDTGEGSSRPSKMTPRRRMTQGESSGDIVSVSRDDELVPYRDICSVIINQMDERYAEDLNNDNDVEEDEYIRAFNDGRSMDMNDREAGDDGDNDVDDGENGTEQPDVVPDDETHHYIAGPAWYEPYEVPEGVTPNNKRLDGSDMKLQDLFNTVDDFDMKIISTGLMTGDVPKPKRKDQNQRVWSCKDSRCEWRARAIRVQGTAMFTLQQYNPYHTCSLAVQSVNHELCTSKFIAMIMVHKFYDVLKAPSIKEVKKFCVEELKQQCSNFKALDAHRKAMALVGGDPFQNYGDIPSYLHLVRTMNEGTQVYLEVDDDERFKYCFIALGASIRGFECMRPVIIIDAAFLKSKFKGQLVVAAASDAEHHIYPLAYGLIDVECNISWTWFLTKFKEVYGDKMGMVFVSDRHNAIINAVKEVFKHAIHVHCYYHLKGNLTSMYPGGGWTKLYYDAAFTCDQGKFNTLMDAMKRSCTAKNKKGKTIYDHLKEDITPEKWARSQSNERRYEIMTSNHVESFNSVMRKAREAPPITLLDAVLNKCILWFNKHRQFGLSLNAPFVPKIMKELKKNFQASGTINLMEMVQGTRYHATSSLFGDHTVDFSMRSCTCGEFQIMEFPCVHACAVLKVGSKACQWTSVAYTSGTFRRAYEETIWPVPNRNQWSGLGVPEDVKNMKCLPPPYVMKKGRQQKTRYPSQGEKVMNIKRRYKCKRCGQPGHSKKYCPEVQPNYEDFMN